jgi:hypothetical protein
MDESSLIFEQSVIIFYPLLASSAVLVWGGPGGGQTPRSVVPEQRLRGNGVSQGDPPEEGMECGQRAISNLLKLALKLLFSCAISHHMGELLHLLIGQIDRLQSRLRS